MLLALQYLNNQRLHNQLDKQKNSYELLVIEYREAKLQIQEHNRIVQAQGNAYKAALERSKKLTQQLNQQALNQQAGVERILQQDTPQTAEASVRLLRDSIEHFDFD